jgi:Tryptophan synthase beta chain
MTYNQPNNKGFYGQFGGQFVPETLMTAVKQLEEAYEDSKKDPLFKQNLKNYLKTMLDEKIHSIMQNA